MRRWVVGSNPSNDFAFDDPYLSNVHCVLERRADGALIVRDASSRNGTFIDGNPIESARAARRRVPDGRSHDARRDRGGGGRGAPRDRAVARSTIPSLRTTIEQAMRAAQTDCSVLVLGETGTGKDLLARVIHEASRRAHGPFVAVNCGAIPRELVASELFGHETRRVHRRRPSARRLVRRSATPARCSSTRSASCRSSSSRHLLRVLETRRVRRVGGTADRPSTFASSPRRTAPPASAPKASRLRPDLYHRLATVVLALPPLRERMCDLGELVEGDARRARRPSTVARRSPTDGWRALASYSWPGNVRELLQRGRSAPSRSAATSSARRLLPRLQHARRRHARRRRRRSPLASSTTAADRCSRITPRCAARWSKRCDARHDPRGGDAIGMPKSTFADKAKAWGLRRRKLRIHRPGYQPGEEEPEMRQSSTGRSAQVTGVGSR